MIREIAQLIENLAGGYFQIDKNLFVGYLPAVLPGPLGGPIPIRCVVVLENTPAMVNGQLPDFAQKPIQVWNRAADFWDAREDAYTIYNLIHGTAGWRLPIVESGPRYKAMVVDAQGTPAPIASPNPQGNFEFSTNFNFMVESP